MRWISGREQPIRYHGDNAFAGQHVGIACLDDRRYIIASGQPIILTYVVDDEARNSLTFKSISEDKDCFCAGIQISDNWSEIYILMHNTQGKVFIERVAFDFDTGEFNWHPTTPIHIPSAYRPLRDYVEINWPREASTISNMMVPQRFRTKGLVLDKYEKIPLGPSLYKYPPVFAKVGTKLIVGINHVQPIGIFYTHQWDYTPKEEFENVWLSTIRKSNELLVGHWVSNLKQSFIHQTTEAITPGVGEGATPTKDLSSVWLTEMDAPTSYLQGEWWRYNSKWEWQQHWGYCHDLYPDAPAVCMVCGEILPCKCNSQIEIPSYYEDEEGNMIPSGDLYEIDRIWCRTLLQHPTLISSLVVIDSLTNIVEGVTHVASSCIGRSDKEDPTFFINGMLSVGDEIDVTFARLKKDIPLSPLRWGNVPLGRDVVSNSVTAEWPLYRILQWYGSSHIPWLVAEGCPMLDGENYYDRRSMKTYKVGELSNGASFINPSIQKIVPSALKTPYLPLTTPDFCVGASASDTNGVGRAVSIDKNWKYEITSHEYVSTYNGSEIGRGQDISVGMVIAGVAKSITVTMTNLDRTRMTLRDIKISVVPSYDYPYYSYVKINGGNTASFTGLAYGASLTFNVTVLCPISQEHPKPVLLKTEYLKIC